MAIQPISLQSTPHSFSTSTHIEGSKGKRTKHPAFLIGEKCVRPELKRIGKISRGILNQASRAWNNISRPFRSKAKVANVREIVGKVQTIGEAVSILKDVTITKEMIARTIEQNVSPLDPKISDSILFCLNSSDQEPLPEKIREYLIVNKKYTHM